MEANFLRAGKATFVVTKNLLHNFVVRDTLPVNASFDKHYESMLGEMNKLFSEAAFMFFVATRIDTEHWRCRGAHSGMNTPRLFSSVVSPPRLPGN
jgi:hypothetical protein